MTKLLCALLIVGCGGKKDDKAEVKPDPGSAVAKPEPKPEAKPIEAKPAAPPVEQAIPETPELERTAKYWLEDKMVDHKAKPAPGIAGVRVPGGCTVTKNDLGVQVGCYSLKAVELGYMERQLLTKDGWTIDSQKRGPKDAYQIELSKGAAKIFIEAVQDDRVGMTNIANLAIMKR